jgi:uncharacterized protein YbaP (TraB family)
MKVFLRWLLLEVLVFLGVVLFAQPVEQSFTPTKAENKLLWEISGKGLAAPSYLYGTIHMIPAENYFLTEATEVAFDKSTRVAFEIDTEEMTNPAAMMGLLSKMYMNNDTTLADLLPEADYAVVSTHFEEMGMPMMFMGKIKPMFLTILAGEDMKDMKPGENPMSMMGGDGMKSYELELTERAKAAEKQIVGLETAEFQMSLFDSIPYTAQAKMLLETIRSGEGEEDEEETSAMDQMIELYTTQDIIGMQSLISDDPAGIGGYEELLLLKRNRNWIPVMEELMTKETVFFAVGAGHLAGDEGVIALLRKAGYTMTPVD